jgi:hypothetical protein
MEKSIETIWKEGFLKNDALIAPKLNNLYNQKSKHIIDKFKRMFKMNLILIVLGSFIVLGGSFLVGLPYVGVPMFIILNVLVILNKKLLNSLMLIDKSTNSYDYLMAFDTWLKSQISINKKFARILYPFVFLSIVVGFWMKSVDGYRMGDLLVKKLLTTMPDLSLIFGIPVIGIIGTIVIVSFLILAGGKIYEWDLKIVYGRVLRKLDEIIADIQELQEE